MGWGQQKTNTINADEDHPYSCQEFLSDDGETDPAQALELDDEWDHFKPLLDKLNEKQRQVMELRFGLNGNPSVTLDKAGKLLGVTRERVRQIQIEALNLLREMY